MERSDVYNLVRPCGEYTSSCGYCHDEVERSVAFGMMADSLSVQAYQNLLDRGWRRSGTFLYKPNNFKTCCPSYTHRLDVNKYQPNKEQIKAIRKLEAYLKGTDCRRDTKDDETPAKKAKTINKRNEGKKNETVQSLEQKNLSELIEEVLQDIFKNRKVQPDFKCPPIKIQPPRKGCAQTEGVKFSSPCCHSVSAVLKKHFEGHKRQAESPKEKLPERNSSEEYIPQKLAEEVCIQLRMRDVDAKPLNGFINFYQYPEFRAQEVEKASKSTEVKAVLRSHQISEEEGVSRDQNNVGADQDFEIRTVRSSRSLIDLEFPLYRKYQMKQHNDPPGKLTRNNFARFLIDSPLNYVQPRNAPNPFPGFGSFHQQYWLNGVLIAVGVVDILPNCLSSKYFFWDPDFAFLSLGRIGAMKEIEYVQKAQKICPDLRYYYLGYYIHSCPKMTYKIKFEPADLLCPKLLRWVPFERVKKVLDSTSQIYLIDDAKLLQDLGSDYRAHTRELKTQDCTEKTSSTVELRKCAEKFNIALDGSRDGDQKTIVPLKLLMDCGVIPEASFRHIVPMLQQASELMGEVSETTAFII